MKNFLVLVGAVTLSLITSVGFFKMVADVVESDAATVIIFFVVSIPLSVEWGKLVRGIIQGRIR